MLLTLTALLLGGLEQCVGRGQKVFASLPCKCIPDTTLPTTQHKILMDGYDTVDVEVKDLCAHPAAPIMT